MDEASGGRSPRIARVESIPPDRLDADALKVIHRLRRFGHEAYFVGGCVRDLLLGRQPKDFDLATSARPRQIKRVFRNCRIIGRRFKLAHIVFGGRIVETATFRRRPQGLEEEGPAALITDDNVFGTAEEDALRRDFTINALFYDPEASSVLDWVGGLADLESGTLRTIGDPWVRFREDPIRILRGVKFASRLGFSVDPTAWEAMKALAPEISKGAPPRILEEILRLLRSGASLGAFRLLRDCGALRIVLPEIAEFLALEEAAGPEGRDRAGLFWRYLEGLDALAHEGADPSNALGFSTLFLHVFRREVDPVRRRSPGPPPGDPGLVVDQVLEPVMRRIRLSRNDAGRIKRICLAQRRFVERRKRRFRPNSFVRQDYFLDSLALFRIQCAATGTMWTVYETWIQRRERTFASPSAAPVGSSRRDAVAPPPGAVREEEEEAPVAAEGGGAGAEVPEAVEVAGSLGEEPLEATPPRRDSRGREAEPSGPPRFERSGPPRGRRGGRGRRRTGGGSRPPWDSREAPAIPATPPAPRPAPPPRPAEEERGEGQTWGEDW